MPMQLFPNMPDNARLWIYAAEAPVSDDESTRLLRTLKPFFADWTSHGRGVTGEASIIEDRFVLVAAYVPGHDVSGCGIDKSVGVLDEVAGDLDIAWASPLKVAYRGADGAVVAASRAEFRRLAEAGELSEETPIFDLSIATVGDLRRQTFEMPARKSWHRRWFPQGTPA